jgi:hypothetical protein
MSRFTIRPLSIQSALRLLLCLVLPAMAACSSPAEQPPLPELTYNALPPLRLDVAQIQIVQSYQPPEKAPNVDHLFPQQPAKVAGRWAQDRLQAVGQGGQGVFTILDASAIDVKLPRSQGLSSLTTVDQTDRYDLTITVRLQVTSADGLRNGQVQASASRSQSISEKTTPDERTVVWYQITQETMNDLNVKLENEIRSHLAGFLQ